MVVHSAAFFPLILLTVFVLFLTFFRLQNISDMSNISVISFPAIIVLNMFFLGFFATATYFIAPPLVFQRKFAARFS